jgi:hypothetical protein
MNIQDLDEFTLLCYERYSVELFSEEEFLEDVNRLSMIKKLLNRYKKSGIINIRMVINHVIILNNVFGQELTNVALFYKVSSEYYSMLKTLLKYSNILIVNDYTNSIPLDYDLLELIVKEYS